MGWFASPQTRPHAWALGGGGEADGTGLAWLRPPFISPHAARASRIAYRLSCNRYTGDDYVDQDKIPTWNMDYVTAMLKGRPCEFALKGGNAQAGEWLATSVALPCARSMSPSDTRTRPPKFATLPCSSSYTPMRRQPARRLAAS